MSAAGIPPGSPRRAHSACVEAERLALREDAAGGGIAIDAVFVILEHGSSILAETGQSKHGHQSQLISTVAA